MCQVNAEGVLAAVTAAAREHHLVTVETRRGERFTDGVCEVFPECGTHIVVFHGHNCVLLDDLTRCAPAPGQYDAVTA